MKVIKQEPQPKLMLSELSGGDVFATVNGEVYIALARENDLSKGNAVVPSNGYVVSIRDDTIVTPLRAARLITGA